MVSDNINILDELRSSKEIRFVVFKLGEEEYGADIFKVKEIRRMEEITRVPKAPYFIEGVINLRGQVIPIINLRKRFGLDNVEDNKNFKIVIVEFDGKLVGMIVDEVSEVTQISGEVVEPPPTIVAGINAEYIIGVAKLNDNKLVIILDLNKILTHHEKEELGNM